MQTRKLYYEDSYAHTFQGKVVATRPDWLALDQTVFYPEGGGQPADYGWLNDQPVTDTQIDEQGLIWHRVELAAAVGDTVEGRIDWLRRFDHMQQHTGQHVLSQVCCQLFQAETVGFHLGEQVVTIDLDVLDLTAADIRQAESLTNAVLRSKLPVRSLLVESEALPVEALRKLPQVEQNIRIVAIEGFDLCPCGGTHVRDLGEIGLLKILGSEKKRGHLRLSFVAGHRAYQDYALKHDLLTRLSALLSEPIENVAVAVERVQDKLTELERENKRLLEQVLVAEAQELAKSAVSLGPARYLVRELSERSLDDARFLASRLAQCDQMLVAFGLPGEPYRLVAAAGADTGVAVGPLLKAALAKYEGKGGGSPRAAQGAVASSNGPSALAQLEQDFIAALQARQSE
ncbi:MAG: hydrolase [Firmicutes bacterium]|jgi:alanyl-tRNA synthetase|nr:hydrolase [Bacillota bacterium]